MTLESLRDAERVIGVKQVTKAVQKSRADAVFLADDADERVTQDLSTTRGQCRCVKMDG